LQRDLDEVGALILEDEADGRTGDSLDADIDLHHRVHKRVCFLDLELELGYVLTRVLLGKTDGRPGVHEEVDPEELHERKGTVLVGGNADEHDQDDADVDGELLLDELLHVRDHVASEDDGLHQHVDAPALQYDVGRVDGRLTRVDAHLDAHVRLEQHVDLLVVVAGDTSGEPDSLHEPHLELLYFLSAVIDAEHWFELFAYVLLGLVVNLIEVCQVLPVSYNLLCADGESVAPLDFFLNRHLQRHLQLFYLRL